MKGTLSMKVGAYVLALVSLTAVIYAGINFRERSKFITPDDGVSWLDSAPGVKAWKVAPDSPGEQAGIKPNDVLKSINDLEVRRATQVSQRLWPMGAWVQVEYKLARGGEEFRTKLITAPAPQGTSIENYLRVVGLLYLFIGLFIFLKRWTAARAVHFYLFCLTSFVLYSFHYTGKLNEFDWQIYWGNVVALLLQPALLLHFALVFPERSSRGAKWPYLAGVYLPPALLLLLHASVAAQVLDFVPSLGARHFLDQIELLCAGAYFLAAAVVFHRSFRRAASGILRQQLKWSFGGTLAGTLPFLLFYVVPFAWGALPTTWMKFSTLSLALIPLCFGYAIIRYRLMDVDIIFKRGLAYTVATAGVVAIYFVFVGLIGEVFHLAWPSGATGSIIAIVVAAFLFQPFREWVQARLDRFFYRDRLDYRRTLIEFGRTMTGEVRLEPMLASVMDRISQTLLVDRIALFLEDPARPGSFHLSRSMGVQFAGKLDLSFLDAGRPEMQASYNFVFTEPGRTPQNLGEAGRRTIEQLELNYFIPCRMHERQVAVLGLGKTVDGDYLSTEDVEILTTMAGYVAIAIDNARLYQSLEQKAVQVERLKDFSENIVESLRVGVLTVDLDGRVDSWNSQLEQLIGVARSEAVGRKLGEVFPAELTAEIESRSAEDQPFAIYKFHLRNGAGRHIVTNVSAAPLVGKGGEKIGRLVVMDEVTQRVQLEEQLLQNEKLTSLGLLAAGVAHEVNTPLAVISNYTQMLARQLAADDPRGKLIEKIVGQTFRASEIVNNLLNFSRTGAAEFREVDLNGVIEETLSLVSHPFKTARVSVIKTLQAPLPAVMGSSNRLQQVFLNLFMNARDAMPSGGMMEVRSAALNGHVEIEVTDTGVGIARESLSRIFDPFYTTKASGRGTGLGLSVSYGIIKEHAGRIDVRSTPGKGTSFRLEFPVARKPVNA